MKPLLTIALFILLLAACTPVVVQRGPLPADIPPGEAGGPPTDPTSTLQEKVVQLATQTPVPTLPPVDLSPTPTTVESQPTPAGTSAASPKTLAELGITMSTFEDKVTGLAFDYPAEWIVIALPDAEKKNSIVYTTSVRSPAKKEQKKFQDAIPPDMVAVDVTVYNESPRTLEQAIAERRAAVTTSETGQPIKIVTDEDITLSGGLKAHRFVYNLGKDPIAGYGDRDKLNIELVTVINDHMVMVHGMGDLSLFDTVFTSLREIPPGK